jgi:hypothetical protein
LAQVCPQFLRQTSLNFIEQELGFIAYVCKDFSQWQNFAKVMVRMEQGKQVMKLGFVNLAKIFVNLDAVVNER